MNDPNEKNVTTSNIISTNSNLRTDDRQRGNSNAANENSEKARWFLMWIAALLAVLGFLAFLVTRDFRILAGDTVFAIPILAIYSYYFPRKEIP